MGEGACTSVPYTNATNHNTPFDLQTCLPESSPLSNLTHANCANLLATSRGVSPAELAM